MGIKTPGLQVTHKATPKKRAQISKSEVRHLKADDYNKIKNKTAVIQTGQEGASWISYGGLPISKRGLQDRNFLSGL